MGSWTFDPMHTQVEFAAKHLGMMTVRGNFTEVSGSGEIDAENLGELDGRVGRDDREHQDP
jgi:polyisoprenoid-binding protein YceI